METASSGTYVNYCIEFNFIDIETIRNSKYYMVPPWCQKNPHFVGRSNLIQTLRNMLRDDNPQKHKHCLALFGLGGVGKTQTAIEYVVTEKNMYNAIFWITATNVSGLLLGFQNIARETGCTNPDETDSGEVATRVVKWLAGQGRWLLVLDNLDDIQVAKDYLPDTTNGGHILITTRNPFTENIPAQGLEVMLLNESDAIELLLLRAGLDNERKEISLIASAIVKELGYLPLAIEQAAAYIREQSKNIFTFLEIYSRYRKRI